MSEQTRQRFEREVRGPNPDVAELALLVCAELEPELDVDAELLRLDAFADQLRADGATPRDPPFELAASLSAHLGHRLGFVGDLDDYHHPDNGLLTRVLDRRRGLPITLSIVWISVAQRLGAHAFGIGLPGHFVAGIGAVDDAVVVDPFARGTLLGTDDLDALVRRATAGQARFDVSMLRPTPAPAIIRRLLHNLTRDFLAGDDVEDALWTVELRQLLPGALPDEWRIRGELLLKLGRYRRAAGSFERYVEGAGGAPDRDEVAVLAVRARAKLN